MRLTRWCARLTIAGLVVALALSAWAGERAKRAKYVEAASAGVTVLQTWYSRETGLYAEPTDWWNAGNAMTVLANYERLTGDKQYEGVLANTFEAAQKKYAGFVNHYYDDDGWWALAWMDAYDLTHEAKYLERSESIFAEMTGGWEDSTCGGGIWWSKDRKYKNAIANELFLKVAAGLANRVSGEKKAEYLKWAEREWKWFGATGMVNAQGLVNDGLNSSDANKCTNNGRRTWSYNQGVILGGLVELYRLKKDRALLRQAEAIADAAIARLVNSDGVMTEPVGGKDAPQFKGIFLRNLMELAKVAPRGERKRYRLYAVQNAESILSSDAGPSGRFGGKWEGPFDSGDATRQTSALDALLAAAAMQ